MTGNSSIDISVANVWRSYRAFRKGKKPSKAINQFEEELLDNIIALALSLQRGTYKHSGYAHMIVSDNKRRDIAVAALPDRIVHRMLYDYLVPIWDKTFIYDAWSCRPNKGLHGATKRARLFMSKYPDSWVWRADITKLFDSVDQDKLNLLLKRRVRDPVSLWLLEEIITTYDSGKSGQGIPIGNLTSQIFANIYLNEFDRFVKHVEKPLAYLRYGDDWLCFGDNSASVQKMRQNCKGFLEQELGLKIHDRIDLIKPARQGVSYLGVDFWPYQNRISKASEAKLNRNIKPYNISSYKALLSHYQSLAYMKRFDWLISEINDKY